MKTQNKNYVSKGIEVIGGKEIEWFRILNDNNGNPRYVVHFLDLGIELEDYGKIKGLTKYRAKWFGGGYVFQSYSIKDDILYAIEKVENYYK